MSFEIVMTRAIARFPAVPSSPAFPGAVRRMRAGAWAAALAITLAACGALAAQNTISVGRGEGEPGDSGIPIVVTGRLDGPIHGYSIALRFPADVLEVLEFGTHGTHVAGLEPEFVAPRIDNDLGVASLGVILDFDEPFEGSTLSETPADAPPRIIGRLIVAVKPNAPGGTHALRLIDGIGSPPAYNRFTVAGTSVVPELESSSFFVRGGNVLSLDKVTAFPGASPNLPVFAYAQHPAPLSGFSVAVTYDCAVLELLEAGIRETDLDFELGRNDLIDFFQTDIDDTIGDGLCRSRTAVIFEFPERTADGPTLSPSTQGPYEQTILQYRFRVLETADDEKQFQDLLLDNLSLPGALNNTFVVGDQSIQPHRRHGKIYFSTSSVIGRVVDVLEGNPVPGARVILEEIDREEVTDATGTFRMDDVIPGTYSVRVESDGFYDGFFDGLESIGGHGVDDFGTFGIYEIPEAGFRFRRGFINADSRADISDAIWLFNWLFQGTAGPTCLLAADVNDDDRVDISDGIFLLALLFAGGRQPNEPWVTCGTDPRSRLDCREAFGCR